jgi:hypothetical protein
MSLRLDLRLLCQNQGDQVIVRKGKKGCAVHPAPVGDSTVTVSSRFSQEGVCSYRSLGTVGARQHLELPSQMAVAAHFAGTTPCGLSHMTTTHACHL